jgi:glycosyltransferase involved in cell wall biosynthesis
MKISVIIPCFNHGATLKRAIDSALPQCQEVVVIDDGSTDDTPAVLDSYAFQPKVKRITHTQNRGVCIARNTAIEQADGDWFVPLDADDALANNVLPVLRVNVNATTFAYGDWLEAGEDGHPVRKHAPEIGMIDRKNVAKATFLFSRSMWQAVNGYDSDFEDIGGEDWSFMVALLEAGYSGVRVELPVYFYEEAQDGRAEKARQNARQLVTLMKQKYPRTMRNAVIPNANDAAPVGNQR